MTQTLAKTCKDMHLSSIPQSFHYLSTYYSFSSFLHLFLNLLSPVHTCKATVHVREVLVVLLLLLSRPYSSIVHVIVGLAASGCGVLRARQATAEPVWQWGITAATATANHFPTGGLYRWLGRPIIVT